MKTLLLMRHAKSSWNSDARNDHDRPLNKRGYRDAPKMALYLQEHQLLPELVISSTAKRTTETWQHMQLSIPHRIPIQYSEDLYHAGLRQIRQQICSRASNQNCIMVLGHNPGWEDAATDLSGLFITMTTANIVILKHSAETWQDCFQRSEEWEFIDQVRPKDLA